MQLLITKGWESIKYTKLQLIMGAKFGVSLQWVKIYQGQLKTGCCREYVNLRRIQLIKFLESLKEERGHLKDRSVNEMII